MLKVEIFLRFFIRLLLGGTILLSPAVVLGSTAPVSILCPCVLERVNQTKADLSFGLIFDKEIDQSGELNIKFRVSNHIGGVGPYYIVGEAKVPSIAYSGDVQQVSVSVPIYAISNSYEDQYFSIALFSGDVNIDRIAMNGTPQSFGNRFGVFSQTRNKVVFDTPLQASFTEAGFSISVGKLVNLDLRNVSDKLEVMVSVTNGAGSFIRKGSIVTIVDYDDDGATSLTAVGNLTNPLNSHFQDSPEFRDVVIWIKRDEDILVRYLHSRLDETELPNFTLSLQNIDTVTDTDGDGLSDFNEKLKDMSSQHAEQHNEIIIEIAFTYGDSARIASIGGEVGPRLAQILSVANISLADSDLNVRLKNIGEYYLGDDSEMSAADVMQALETRDGIFSGLDDLFSRKPDIIVHASSYSSLGTGGLATLLGARNDGIIDYQNAFQNRSNKAAISLDGSSLILAHEIGHTLGLVHARRQYDDTPGGTFRWSHGYGVDNDFVTIMGYRSAFGGASRVGFFSSPNIACGPYSTPCGVERKDFLRGADSVSSIKVTANQVAAISNGFSPHIQINGSGTLTVESVDELLSLGVSAFDKEDGDISGSIMKSLRAVAGGNNSHNYEQLYSVTDSDNNTSQVVRPINAPTELDTDGDTISDFDELVIGTDFQLADSDGDGVEDNIDEMPTDVAEVMDTDLDGIGDTKDDDDDSDGVSDLQEMLDGTNPLDSLDCVSCPDPVSGHIYDWKSHTLMQSVELTLNAVSDNESNQKREKISSDELGNFSFERKFLGLNELLAVKPSEIADHEDFVTSADALAALKIAVGINPNPDPDSEGPLSPLPVSPYQYIAADVNKDGRVTSADALAILKMAVNLGTSHPARWIFIDERFDFWDASSNSGDGGFVTKATDVVWSDEVIRFNYPDNNIINLVGVLVGDVNGSANLSGLSSLSSDYFLSLSQRQSSSVTQWGMTDPETEVSIPTGLWEPGVFEEHQNLAQICESPRPSDLLGTMSDENNWIRSWSNDTYLWYDELPDIDPSSVDNNIEYFNLMKTDGLTPAGKFKDPPGYHHSIPTEQYLAQVAGEPTYGYGMELMFFNPPQTRRIFVIFNQPGTVASRYSIDRGTEILSVNGEMVAGGDQSVILAGLNPTSLGTINNFLVRSWGSSGTRSISMQGEEIPQDHVMRRTFFNIQKSLDTQFNQVGYLLFNDHSVHSEGELVEDFSWFMAQNIDELVLDLRYNRGGLSYVASQVGYMIAGESSLGRVFLRYTFNKKHTIFDPVTGGLISGRNFLAYTYGNTAVTGLPLNRPLPSLNLSRVFILADRNTCSASELIINGLRGIGVEVVLIGGGTCGKPYGGYYTDNCGTTYYTIQMKAANETGFGDYSDGFIPTLGVDSGGSEITGCLVDDFLGKPLGSRDENMLAAALYYVANGECPNLATNALQKTGPLVPLREGQRMGTPSRGSVMNIPPNLMKAKSEE
ncbi:MAG: hypothetical protein CBC09_02275 [Cellvibrionales bacterium TMED49]|nr:MAG: hypothetical protein CBC09_02275 [Cellvibrionales bacterium TMED49]